MIITDILKEFCKRADSIKDAKTIESKIERLKSCKSLAEIICQVDNMSYAEKADKKSWVKERKWF